MTWKDVFNAAATMTICIMLITLAIMIAIVYQMGGFDGAIAQIESIIIKGNVPDWATHHIVVDVDNTITFDEFCEHRVYALGNVVCTQPQGIIVYHIPNGAHIIDKRGPMKD